MKPQTRTYINALKLQPHPEGGYYRETYRSVCQVDVLSSTVAGSKQSKVARSASTGIYFLIEQGNFSAFHKITSDEMWHFYAGDALEVLELDDSGVLSCVRIGPAILQGEVHQYVVKANTWFASRVAAGGAFSLVGCTVSPGFDFSDFSLADRAELIGRFPQHQQLIAALTR